MKKDYVNGSDMLLYINGEAVGHCSSHSVSFSSETKDRAVKPVASAALESGLYKGKGVTGLSYTISAEGLVFYNETESGFRKLLSYWKTGKPVEIKCMERGGSKPYLSGSAIIKSLERTDPAVEDSKYSISLENNGAPEIDETALTEAEPTASSATSGTGK